MFLAIQTVFSFINELFCMLNEDFSKQAKIETALLSTCMNFDVIPRLFKRGFDKNIL